jgi:hypothetical protein
MNDATRIWFPIPAWWVPVWITLDSAGESTDALETAVEAMVRAGLRAPAVIARELCLDTALVESAIATLASAGVITQTADGLSAKPRSEPGEGPRSRAGFIAWDPSAQRPLLQLWVAREPPLPAVEAPPGWRLSPWSEPDDYPQRPRTKEVAERLGVLPSMSGLRTFEPRGNGVHESDGGRVRRLRERSGPSARLPIWAPVEHRMSGPVVWRPSLRPIAEVGTELDPAGYEGVVRRALVPGASEALADAEREHRDRIAPGVVRQAGFTSVDDLRAEAKKQVSRDLGAITNLPGWQAVVQLAEDAVVDELISPAVGGDWRRPLRAWGDVLETLTALLIERLRPIVIALEARSVDPDERASIRLLLGPSTDHTLSTASNPEHFKQLKDSVQGRLDTIGTRVLAFGVCALLHLPTRRAFERLADQQPSLFETLGRAKSERNDVVHPKATTEAIGVAGHRARVVLLCRTLPMLDIEAASS